MKTLKFMLAAATAIGLASATQADEFNTTGFEKLTVGTNVTTGVQDNRSGYSYFYYTGSVAEDNESVIAAAGDMTGVARPRGAASVDAGRDKILQVSTGTDPLLRTYQGFTGQSPVAATTLANDVYVDTLVQFTVTPYTDTVTNTAADKLMIYLKECTNAVGTVTGTNLVVVGGFYAGNATTPREYVLDIGASHKKIEPNTWHRLTVKAIVDISAGLGASALQMPGFAIWVDGEECILDYYTMDENDQMAALIMAGNTDVYAKKQVLSLLTGSGGLPASLQGVGFAGEGKVDDIVFSELDPFATVYDFTFAFDATKVSAIEYTVAGTSYTYARTFPEVSAGTEVQITSVTYADAWLAGTIDAVNMSDPVAGVYTVTNAGASLTITPEQFFPRTNTADQDGTADHPYEVADAAALSALQKGVLAGKNLTGVNFVQTGNIDMTDVTDFYGIGWFKSSDSYASLPPGLPSASTDKPFTGVYDGGGYKISNVRLVRHNYAGVFNCVEGTVKNLTVENLGFTDTSAGEWGCGIVGNAQGTAVLEYLTAATSAQNGFWGDNAPHNTAGIAARAEDSATIRYCVNNAAITASAKRLGGIISFTGTAGAASDVVSIIGCTNNGALYSSNGTRGVGGIIASPESATAGSMTLIKDCANFGALTVASGGFTGEIVGSMGVNANSTWQDDGGNTFLASGNLVGTRGSNTKAIVGLAYALPTTIDAVNYLTTVKQSDLAAGNTYTLLANVAASETPVFTLQAAGDTIAFDSNGFTDAGTVAAAAGLNAASSTSDGVTTWTASAIAYAITFISGEGSTTNVLNLYWGEAVNAPAAAEVAGKTFTAWDPAVVTPVAGDATYTATYDWITCTIKFISGEGSTTNEQSVTWGTAVVPPTAATVEGKNFSAWDPTVVTPAAGDATYTAVYVAAGGSDWAADPMEIPAEASAATQYPALADSALATANAKQLTTWATANSINFSDVADDTTGTLTEAFLLNCATADVAQEKEEFVLDITVGADGTISVSLPDGKSYNGTLQMKGSNNLSTWDPVNSASSSYKFYKYELSL